MRFFLNLVQTPPTKLSNADETSASHAIESASTASFGTEVPVTSPASVSSNRDSVDSISAPTSGQMFMVSSSSSSDTQAVGQNTPSPGQVESVEVANSGLFRLIRTNVIL